VYVASAWGAHFHCVDGIDHIDFCLGDSAALAGHAPAAVVSAMSGQLEHGATFTLPTRRASQAGDLLADRFGLSHWQFAVSASAAVREVVWIARHVTRRRGIVVHEHGPHADEVPDAIPVPFNDIQAMRAVLQTGEVAAVIAEPALTCAGLVVPEPGYLDAIASGCSAADVILVIDERHTAAAGARGYARQHGLAPDVLILGDSVGGGAPTGILGMSQGLAERVRDSMRGGPGGGGGLDRVWTGETGEFDGGTGGSALSVTGVVATLGEVLTERAYESMIARAAEWADGVRSAIDEFSAPWHVTQLGSLVGYGFRDAPPRDGRQAAEARDPELERYLRLHAINRGILLSPTRGTALMSPATTSDDVARHTIAFREALASLYGS